MVTIELANNSAEKLGVSVAIELDFLKGPARFPDTDVFSLISLRRVDLRFNRHTAGVLLVLVNLCAGMQAQEPAPMQRVSGGVMAGLLIKKISPFIPSGVSTSYGCILHAIIGVDGAPKVVEIINAGNSALGSACVDAVEQWRYKPYLLNGKPTQVDTTITIYF